MRIKRTRRPVGRSNLVLSARIAVFLILKILALPAVVVASDEVKLDSELIADRLVAPIDIVLVPDGSDRRLILDQSGVIHWLLADNTVPQNLFADLRDRMLALEEGFEERGLLGLAVHPEFAQNGRLFVTYTAPKTSSAPGNWNYTRIVSEFTVDKDNKDQVDVASERILIEQHWPSRKHNGGALGFGPDGYLYIGFGDGGGIHGIGPEVLNDAFNVPPEREYWDGFAQDHHSLYGKILRIDVDRGYPGYAVPDDNPLVGKPGRDEIYAWGFRNPYRIAFDPSGDGSFFVTAVAETFWEAIYRVDKPGNYGWPLYEGTHCFDRQAPLDPPVSCDTATTNTTLWPIRQPVVEYPNMSVHREGSRVQVQGVGTAVVGALMLRDSELTAFNDQLLIGDWSLDFRKPSGQLFRAIPSETDNRMIDTTVNHSADLWQMQPITVLDTRIVALAQDAAGRVYLLTNDNLGPYGETGKVYRLSQAQQ